ncbi:MAG: signal peptidase II [Candidatus Obscuribacterales bacterium]|jgi:signal peptidase II|nr:signal peptidase II [Candidatus Obscuribacterales bacterium]
MNGNKRGWLLTGTITALAFLADLISKAWASDHLSYNQIQPLLSGILQLTLTKNSGVAFGMAQGNVSLVTLLTCLIFAGLLFWLIRQESSPKPPSNLERIGMALILGGALGNIIDRIRHGEVTDFLEFVFISFPVFNVADALIDIGAALIIISALFGANRNDK